jgi:hypothetical protein
MKTGKLFDDERYPDSRSSHLDQNDDRSSTTCPLNTIADHRCRQTAGSRSHILGGADRDRTDDLRLAKPALSQLSYSPESHRAPRRGVSASVGQGRLELPTSRLSGVCSNQLSYWPEGVSFGHQRGPARVVSLRPGSALHASIPKN